MSLKCFFLLFMNKNSACFSVCLQRHPNSLCCSWGAVPLILAGGCWSGDVDNILRMFFCFFYLYFFSAFCICFGVMVVANLRVDGLWVRPNSYSLHVQLVTDKKYVTTGQCFSVFLIKLLWCSFWWMMITKQSQCSLLVKRTIRLLVSVPLDLN